MKYFQLFIGLFFLLPLGACQDEEAKYEQLRDAALKRLHYNLLHQEKWVKVHAAEYLIDLGHRDLVDSVFHIEEAKFGKESPYRIGIWRVLSQTDKQVDWVAKIIEVAQDSSANDQLFAIESLAKLQVETDWFSEELHHQIFSSDNQRLKYYARWALVAGSKNPEVAMSEAGFKSLRGMLFGEDMEARQVAALAIFNLGYYPEGSWDELADLALAEKAGAKTKVLLIAAAMYTNKKIPKPEKYQTLESLLMSHENNYSKNDRFFLCETLAKTGRLEHLQSLNNLMLMNHPIFTIETLESPQEHPWNIDVAGAAAYGILKILGN